MSDITARLFNTGPAYGFDECVSHTCKKTNKWGNDNKKILPKIITNDDVKNVLRNYNIK